MHIADLKYKLEQKEMESKMENPRETNLAHIRIVN